MTEITAKKKDSEKSVKVSYDMPETLDALVEKFGAEAVAGAATDSFTISIQSVIRRNFDKSQEEIEAAVAAWLPGVRQAGVKKSPAVDTRLRSVIPPLPSIHSVLSQLFNKSD